MKTHLAALCLALLLIISLSVPAFAETAEAPQPTKGAENVDASTPEGAFNAFMQAIKGADYTAAQKYAIAGTADPEPDAETLAIMKALGLYLSWSVSSVDEKDEFATLEVSITNTKLTNFMQDALKESLLGNSDIVDNPSHYLTDYVKRMDKTLTFTLAVPAVKYQDNWKVVLPNDKFTNAFSGNLFTGTLEFLEEMNEVSPSGNFSDEWLADFLAS